MVAAMQSGASVVGGMPHWERTEDEQREHVRFCFALATRYGADVDMHVDETDDGSVRTLAMVVAETERVGWQGRVTVGHVCSLAAADDDYADEVIAGCARAGITVVANPVTNLVIQGRGDRGLVRRGTTRVRELMAAGVNVAFGQDCVQDGFYPFGRGDMLEVALISAHAAHLATADEQLAALDAVTTAPATAWRLDDYGVAAGARADLQLYAAPHLERGAAPAGPTPRRLVARTAGGAYDDHPGAVPMSDDGAAWRGEAARQQPTSTSRRSTDARPPRPLRPRSTSPPSFGRPSSDELPTTRLRAGSQNGRTTYRDPARGLVHQAQPDAGHRRRRTVLHPVCTGQHHRAGHRRRRTPV